MSQIVTHLRSERADVSYISFGHLLCRSASL